MTDVAAAAEQRLKSNETSWSLKQKHELESELSRLKIENKIFKSFLRSRRLALEIPSEDLDKCFHSPSTAPLLKTLLVEKIDSQADCVKKAADFFPLIDRLARLEGQKPVALDVLLHLAESCLAESNCTISRLHRSASSWTGFISWNAHVQAEDGLDQQALGLIKSIWRECGDEYDPQGAINQISSLRTALENEHSGFRESSGFLSKTLHALREIRKRSIWLRILLKSVPPNVPPELVHIMLDHVHDESMIMEVKVLGMNGREAFQASLLRPFLLM